MMSALLLSVLIGTSIVDLATANPIYQKPAYDNVTMQSPQQNQTYNPQVSITLRFTVKANDPLPYSSYFYTLDGSGESLTGPVWNDMGKLNIQLVSEVVISDDSASPGYPPYLPYTECTFDCSATLPRLSEGKHNVTIYRGLNKMNIHGGYYPLLTVYFAVSNPPVVTVLSLGNNAHVAADVPLNFAVSKPFSKIAYSLDGQANVTVSGNTTLTGLSSGQHSLTVYAWDTLGSVGASETVTFTVEPFPKTWIAVAFVASIAAVAFGLLAYSIKKQKNKQLSTTNHELSINPATFLL
jgi:hypothetical protein